MKYEANSSLVLRHYIKAEKPQFCMPIEVKDTRGKLYLPFNEVKEEQINNALASKSPKGNLIRIASGTIGAPDYVWLINVKLAPVFIRYPKHFIIIDIEAFIKARDSSPQKSLTLEKAKQIAYKIVDL